MTPDEKQMIQDFFARLASQKSVDKDGSAEALIAQEMRRNPDAAYLLVQTALVYEHQMGELEEHVRDLEQQLEDNRSAAPTSSGSFLGGRLGQGRSSQSNQDDGAGYARLRNNQRPADEDARPAAGRASPWSAQAPSAAAQPVKQAPAQGGGFFRSAMATAAGVAGGMMLGDGLRGLFGGGQAHAQGADPSADKAALADSDRTQDQLQDELADRDAQLADLDAQSDSDQDADYGDDDGSFDV